MELTIAVFPPDTPVDLPASDDRLPIVLSTHELGSGPAVVLCHGFPDLAFGWRHQLEALAEAGFRAIAPDQRGYGASSAPADPALYSLSHLTADLVGLLDALDIERAWFVGHDWGGFVAWAMPVLHPDRVQGVAALCTPYIPFPSVATHLSVVGGAVERQYVAWFQEPGVAEAEMDANVEVILSRVFRSAVPLEEAIEFALADGALNMNPFTSPGEWPLWGDPLAQPDELGHYVDVFERTGFRGGINWYRNIDRNAAEHPDLGTRRLDIPGLILTAELDPALRPEFADGMEDRIADLTRHDVAGVGHWMQQEAPETVNAHLINWLTTQP